jgi:hypothetical protein
MCTNKSSSNQCKYLTQETRCMGPSPLKCQCLSGKYFNKDTSKCEKLFEIGENCSQADSCKNGYCFGSPSNLKCQCLTLQYFDLNSGLCRDNISISASPTTTILSSTTLFSTVTTSKIY